MSKQLDDRLAKTDDQLEDDFDKFVPERLVLEEFEVTPMTIHRWDNDEKLRKSGWPPPIYIRGRKYRSRKMLQEFKDRFLKRAIETRGKAGKPPSPRQAKINKRAA